VALDTFASDVAVIRTDWNHLLLFGLDAMKATALISSQYAASAARQIRRWKSKDSRHILIA
jgi:hypothetical protein